MNSYAEPNIGPIHDLFQKWSIMTYVLDALKKPKLMFDRKKKTDNYYFGGLCTFVLVSTYL